MSCRRKTFVMLNLGVFLTALLPGCAAKETGRGELLPDRETSQPRPLVQFHLKAEGSAEAYIDVVGLDAAMLAKVHEATRNAEQWAALLSVRVIDPGRADPHLGPALLGDYRVTEKTIRFEPRFPLQPGLRYRAEFNPSALPPSSELSLHSIDADFVIPKRAMVPATVVEHVYPTANTLPENQLKFYLHFSGPMSRGEAYRHLRLLDASGKEVELPFLELDQELWDPQGKRFTLFFDPGRIKRGLKPREEVGPSLEEGKRYTLVIDAAWIDAEGNPLKATYRKKFQVGPPEDRPLDPKTWKLEVPSAGTRTPFLVTFPRPLDHALMERMLWVVDAADQKVQGRVDVSGEEMRWRFAPDQPWQPGRHHLVADTALEDLAGNSIGRPFEVDVFRPIQREVRTDTARLPFEVHAGK